jgi:hypothetical protein
MSRLYACHEDEHPHADLFGSDTFPRHLQSLSQLHDYTCLDYQKATRGSNMAVHSGPLLLVELIRERHKNFEGPTSPVSHTPSQFLPPHSLRRPAVAYIDRLTRIVQHEDFRKYHLQINNPTHSTDPLRCP